jgi:outer membrane protein assembly factor BamB
MKMTIDGIPKLKLAGIVLVVTMIWFSSPMLLNHADGQNWANWRGPEQNGLSREKNLPSEWSLEPRKNVAWVSETGGRSTPIVLNGRVYLNCRTPDDINDPDQLIHSQDQVVCWDADTGEELWRDKFNVFQTDIPAPRVGWASMCGDEETGYVYVHTVSGIFRCYAPDGKVIWEHSLSEDFGKISGYGGRTQTPIIDEDRVILSFMATNWGATKGPAPLHYYYAFDKKTGTLQWVSAPGGAPKDTNYSVPVVSVINGQRMLIGGNCDGHVYAMNARTGKPIWSFRMSKRGLNTTPVVEGNMVFISHGEDNIDSPEFGRVQCIDATGTGDVTDTHGVWRVDGIKAGYTALMIHRGVLFVMADLGNLYAFDTQTGKRLWDKDLGTVGKGSPVWADGKIYAPEVNGHLWILKASLEDCKTLSKVKLSAADGNGSDEIYSSPAIANGKIYLVTRDRTICIADETKEPEIGKPLELAEEAPATEEVDLIQLRPYETIAAAGSKTEYEVHAFDANGRFIKKMPAELTLGEDLSGFSVDGARLIAPTEGGEAAGLVTAKLGELSASARVRMFDTNPEWNWGFDGYKGVQVPPTWSRAFVKLKPMDLDGETVMKVTGGKGMRGRPSHQITIGPASLVDYSVQADVRLTEQRRQLASIGLSCDRYNLILKGNTSKLTIQSWPPHRRMAKEIKYRSDPDIWYTMKMKVDQTEAEATIYGKVWKRGEAEPDEWTITTTDPHPNMNGAPGLYFYAQADCYFDNVIVTREDN